MRQTLNNTPDNKLHSETDIKERKEFIVEFNK